MADTLDKPLYMATAQEVAAVFSVRTTKGLSVEQVKQNRERAPEKNRIIGPKLPIIFWSVLLISFCASIATFLLTDVKGSLLYGAAALLFVVFSIAQQNYVKHILHIIVKFPKATQTVKRDGGAVFQVLPSELVKGDVVVLKEGDFVGADMRLIEVKNLLVDEVDVTGVASVVSKNTFAINKKQKLKDQKNMVFGGSYINSGSGLAIVVGPTAVTTSKINIPKIRLKKDQKFRRLVVLLVAALIGLSLMLLDIGLIETSGLTILFVVSTYFYVTYWLRVTSWASLYEKFLNMGFQANSIAAVQDIVKTDTIFINITDTDVLELAAFVHTLQAELNIEVRAVVEGKKRLKELEQELNIQDSALAEKDFLGSRRDKKMKSLREYQFLIGFSELSINEALSLFSQSGHEVLIIDDKKIPESGNKIVSSYINLDLQPTGSALKQVTGIFRSPSLRKTSQLFNEVEQFRKTTGY